MDEGFKEEFIKRMIASKISIAFNLSSFIDKRTWNMMSDEAIMATGSGMSMHGFGWGANEINKDSDLIAYLLGSEEESELARKRIQDSVLEYANEQIQNKRLQPREEKQILNKRSGYVYVYKVSGYYKIGKSVDPKNRLKKYITEAPDDVEVIFEIKTDDYSRLEKMAHYEFQHKKYRGEWFDLSQDDVRDLIVFLEENK